MDATTLDARIADATNLAVQQALDAILGLESDLAAARAALLDAALGQSYSPSHLEAYGNRYLAVPRR